MKNFHEEFFTEMQFIRREREQIPFLPAAFPHPQSEEYSKCR
jgi:hypothetical protein